MFEILYTGRATVYEKQPVKNATTARTTFEKQAVYTDIPCRLSFESSNHASYVENVAEAEQLVRLFCAPDYQIKKGSEIEVTQNGQTVLYVSASEPARYINHIEINLRLIERC